MGEPDEKTTKEGFGKIRGGGAYGNKAGGLPDKIERSMKSAERRSARGRL